MSPTATATCPACSRANDKDAWCCDLCGHVLRRVSASPTAPPAAQSSPDPAAAPDAQIDAPHLAHLAHREHFARVDSRRGVRILLAGAVLANAFALPVLSYMGWFFSSLVHEMGHAAAGCALGLPTIPAIRLDGHAAAVHGAPSTTLLLLVMGVLAWLAWHGFRAGRRAAPIALACLVPALPLLASGTARDVVFLGAGHVGELVVAGLFLRRALADPHGERSDAERVMHATLGSYLAWKNLALFFGLMTSTEAVAEYWGNGSFGLTNDLIRLAEDHLRWPLSVVAGTMFSIALIVPLAMLLWPRACAAQGAPRDTF